ncbi:mannose-1-phosphate guanylyltransferase [Chondromyces apiculatus]|uniref:Mannose-1-phosphate guanylyltransferase (GDP) n=1 Tax=Chondromyces apiculatus DSM 436 TaxID=1192034 RepID=A0A017T9J7_9BACT|nr:mannose-1-phosphate guanylyltransferase [Chondromyces apiculatus]EYF05948.1 Mannose-1-phosphate guanylyltransferase (GDP) [Chondromyces apiculatus DSM 436]
MSDAFLHVHALILAGGAGTRFWPASRAVRPKQLLSLVGDEPLLCATVHRVLPLCHPEDTKEAWARVLIATGSHLAEATQALLPELPEENLLVEPLPRNTAPCIGWAAWRIAAKDPEAVVMVLPSDHHVSDVEGFRRVLQAAVRAATQGTLTTVGIRPTHPETGFGYIETGEARGGGALEALRFVEKPDRQRAEGFVASGRFLWNAGMFFFRAKDMVAAIRAHLPALAEGLDAIREAEARGGEAGAEALARVFPTLPSVSIDHGVMEHAAALSVVPGDFGWSDVGSFRTAWDLGEKDPEGNHAPEGSVLIDAHRNLVVDLRRKGGGKRVIALVGVEDLCVVETEDALLVVPRERAQDVKRVVDALKERGDGELT